MTKLAKEALLKPEQLAKLKELFPQAVVDGKVDFVSLKALLGDQVEDTNEKYQFTWNGKQNAIAHAQKPSSGTLREDKASSKNFDSTENLYIEGDNLEVLKLLQKTYQGKIKMIYIDPPYNTGNDFVYKDDFKDNVKNYLELTNQKNKSNAETSGRYHTDWLNMMYPRLMLARNLLTDDGVIFISIDDNEQSNLKKICDEIFGEGNFVTQFVYEKTTHFGRQKVNYYSNLEYVFCYFKSKFSNSGNIKELLVESINDQLEDAPLFNGSNPERKLFFPAESVVFNIADGEYSSTTDPKYKLYNSVIVKNGTNLNELVLSFQSRWSQEKINQEFQLGCKFWVKSNNFAVRAIYQEGKTSRTSSKQLLFANPNNPMVTINRFNKKIGTNEEGTAEVKDLFSADYFSYPKAPSLIEYLTSLLWDYQNEKFINDSIILDFFSGSGTTAHAVMKLNAEDGGNRRFIMVQLPEKTEEDSEAYKAGYQNICEIGKERIRRAGEKVKQEMLDKDSSADVSKLDVGFKVFKLDSTNIKPWDGTQDINQMLLEASGNVVKTDRTDLDVVYELMLMYGVFNEVVEEIKINGKTLYSIGEHFLMVCLFKSITKQDIEAIIKLKPKNVIFNDAGFENDNVKINAELTLKNHGVEDIKSL